MEIDRLNKVINDIKNFYLNKDPEGPQKIQNVITQIKNVYSSGWEKDRLPFIREFCSKVSLGAPVAALSVCGRITDDKYYNKYLAYFLDPRSQHGLGDRVIRALIGTLGDDIDNVDLSQCTVETGKWMVGYRCDISVTGKDYCILIEQKLLNSESVDRDAEANRLKRYDDAINNNEEFKNLRIIKIYLTSEKKKPEGVEDWHPITYESIAEECLKLYKDETLSHTARGNLIRFVLDISPEPYCETEEDIKNMLDTGNSLISSGFDFSKAVQLDRLLNENKLVVRLLMEG